LTSPTYEDARPARQPKALLKAGQHAFLGPGLHMDDPIGRQSSLRQRRGKQILTGDAPQDLTASPRRDPGREQGCRRAVTRACKTASDVDTNLSEMVIFVLISESVGELRETKAFVDDGPQPNRVDAADHLDLVETTANNDAL